jgi:hypothetical protein
MLEQIKNNLQLVLTGVVAILLTLNIKQCSTNNDKDREFERFDKAIYALTDSVKRYTNSKGETVFGESAVEFDVNKLINSEAFKKLSEKDKEFYIEIKKTRGIIAKNEAIIKAQDSLLKELKYNLEHTYLTDSTVCFNKGAVLEIQDSTSNLSYSHNIKFGEVISSKLKYTYNAKITTQWRREKDKSIVVEYKLDDPSAEITSSKSFIIPQENRTGLQKFMDKNGKYIYFGLGVATGGFLATRIK